MKRVISLILIICFLSVTLGCGGKTIPSKPGEAPKLARTTGSYSSIAGVCSGWAYFTGTPSWVWRTGFVLATVFWGGGLLAYIVLWIFMPEYETNPVDFEKRTGR